MAGPVEAATAAGVGLAAIVVAALMIPLPRHKPAEPAEPVPIAEPAAAPGETLADQETSDTPEPETPVADLTEIQRITKIEQTVHEIKLEQRKLDLEIRALVKEVKAK